ncbi:MAG: glycosyltransferase family 39 protein [Anaerolineae bacterium]|nr:glycosyltransferase family 39 protein [Anaerolineae bacterium]
MRGRAPKGSAPWALILILAAFCTLGAIHSVVIPLFEAPDEIWHFSFVHVLATQRALPVQSSEVKDVWLREAGQPPLYHLTAALLVAPLDMSDFPGFVRFNIAHPAIDARSESESPNVFIHTPHEAFPYRGAVLAVHLVRLCSVLWGAGAIVGAYLVARELAPDRTGLAPVSAAVAALNPHFVFISSVVNNDAAFACLCTLVLWLSIRLARGTGRPEAEGVRQRPGSVLALGVLLGLALLSKLSALALVPLVALALALTWWRERDTRSLLARGCAVYGLAALVAGWWYVRNWALYGDPLGWSVWILDLPEHRVGLVELARQLGHVGMTFWSPVDDLFPPPVFWGFGLLLAMAVAGWCRWIVRIGRGEYECADGLLLAGTWFVLLLASLVRYMTITPSAEGRFLLPAIASTSLLLVLGWEAVVPERWAKGAASALGVGLLALCAASPFFAIAPRYPLPLIDSIQDIQAMVPFEGGPLGDVRLLGVGVEPRDAQAGERVHVTLYWEAVGAPPADLRSVVRLWTAGGRLIGQRDSVLAGEVYPPDLWRAGDIVRDVYRFEMPGSGPALYRVSVSVSSGDESLGSRSSANAFKLVPPPLSGEITRPLAYNLDDKVALIGVHVADDPGSPGGALVATFYWRALGEMSEAYTVFVHLVDAHGVLLGQGDGPPLGGDYPTPGWSPGEELADTHVVPAGAGLPAGARLSVGLYRVEDGTRLPVYASTGARIPGDAISLDLEGMLSAPVQP